MYIRLIISSPISSPLLNQLSKCININNNNHETSAQSSKKPSRGGSWETPVKSKSGKIIDQAVTFHNRIKSSGYGQPDAFEKWKLKQQVSITYLYYQNCYHKYNLENNLLIYISFISVIFSSRKRET